MNGLQTTLEYLPFSIRKEIMTNIKNDEEKIEEIRLRSNKPLILKCGSEVKVYNYIVSQNEVLQAFDKICENSIYSYKRQICEGYITIKGGNRVGIVGSGVIENGQVININYISSLNFRISRQKIGCSNQIVADIINFENNTIYNTLIISPPGAGKTTLLRDIIRNISNGFYGFEGQTVGVADERGEIAAMYKGIPQNDIGIRTDVIDNMPKADAMKILIRSMAPNVIASDEIGSKEDIEAINYAICSGVKGIFTAHGKSLEEIHKNRKLAQLIENEIIEKIVILNVAKKGEYRCITL